MDYTDYIEPTDEGQLSQLQALADQQWEAEKLVEQKQRELNTAQEQLRDLAERQIPEAMDACGMETLTTRSGLHLSVKETIRASIPKAKADAALSWLRDNGHASLIKRTVSAQFGKGEDEWAQGIHQELEQQGCAVKDDEKVHPQTLAAFVREKLENGEDVPQETLGVHRQRVAKLKR